MRVLLQRVSEASLLANGEFRGAIRQGLVVFVGIETQDGPEDVKWLVNKILQLRIFSDAEGKMNLSVQDTGGSLMVVSQFTLHAQTAKGNRPSFIRAAPPQLAIPLYEDFLGELTSSGVALVSGIFGADMKVSLVNDGPVTIWMDSRER